MNHVPKMNRTEFANLKSVNNFYFLRFSVGRFLMIASPSGKKFEVYTMFKVRCFDCTCSSRLSQLPPASVQQLKVSHSPAVPLPFRGLLVALACTSMPLRLSCLLCSITNLFQFQSTHGVSKASESIVSRRFDRAPWSWNFVLLSKTWLK